MLKRSPTENMLVIRANLNVQDCASNWFILWWLLWLFNDEFTACSTNCMRGCECLYMCTLCWVFKAWNAAVNSFIHLFSLSDPFVKVYLLQDGRKISKKKTSTKRDDTNPIFNEAMIFSVPSIVLQVTLLKAQTSPEWGNDVMKPY